MNKCIMMGRLTRDPELRKTSADVSVCSFTLAIERDYKKMVKRRPILSTLRSGARVLISLPNTLPKAVWLWWRAGWKSETGRIRNRTNGVLQWLSQNGYALPIPSRR